MKIVIPGGSGQVGTLLARAFYADGHDVVILSRNSNPNTQTVSKNLWRSVYWDAETEGTWVSELEGADVVINLAGRSVNCRYNAKNRQEIKESRVRSTRVIGEAIAKMKSPPPLWLQASTATIYAHRYDAPNNEETGILGGDANAPDTWRFSLDIAESWEATLNQAITPQTRKVALRTAMVMSPDRDGVFDVLLGLVRFWLGGRSGNGKQYVSWIHYKDLIQAIYWIIQHEKITGAINLCSPNPLPNAEFMRAIRKAWGTAIGLPATEWMLEIGAVFLRTETELILKSRRVIPSRLLKEGFSFQYPIWTEAVQNLCLEWRQNRN